MLLPPAPKTLVTCLSSPVSLMPPGLHTPLENSLQMPYPGWAPQGTRPPPHWLVSASGPPASAAHPHCECAGAHVLAPVVPVLPSVQSLPFLNPPKGSVGSTLRGPELLGLCPFEHTHFMMVGLAFPWTVGSFMEGHSLPVLTRCVWRPRDMPALLGPVFTIKFSSPQAYNFPF